jgi:hypothetical protein
MSTHKQQIAIGVLVVNPAARTNPTTSMLFGDARQSLLDLALQVKVA